MASGFSGSKTRTEEDEGEQKREPSWVIWVWLIQKARSGERASAADGVIFSSTQGDKVTDVKHILM